VDEGESETDDVIEASYLLLGDAGADKSGWPCFQNLIMLPLGYLSLEILSTKLAYR
jgi:hypothetical protein